MQKPVQRTAYPHPHPLACKACGKVADAELSWQRFRNGEIHLRANCGACRSYLGYVPQTPENIAAAPPMP